MTELHAVPEPDVVRPSDGRARVALSNALVRIWKEHYGRGPTSARAVVDGNMVFVILQDGLTRNEETLLAAGRQQVVRDFRATFMDTMREHFNAAVSEITGRTVLAHEGQMTFEPTMTIEIFVLDGPIQ
jgi:uncharacterized protein YbcI